MPAAVAVASAEEADRHPYQRRAAGPERRGIEPRVLHDDVRTIDKLAERLRAQTEVNDLARVGRQIVQAVGPFAFHHPIHPGAQFGQVAAEGCKGAAHRIDDAQALQRALETL